MVNHNWPSNPLSASSLAPQIRLWLTIVRVYKLYLLTYLLTVWSITALEEVVVNCWQRRSCQPETWLLNWTNVCWLNLQINTNQNNCTTLTLTTVWSLQLPTTQTRTLSRILSGNLPSVQTVSDVCLKRICSLDTSTADAPLHHWR